VINKTTASASYNFKWQGQFTKEKEKSMLVFSPSLHSSTSQMQPRTNSVVMSIISMFAITLQKQYARKRCKTPGDFL
jgi:hypothetical protein